AQGGPAPMIRHALRTLVKQGDPGALALLGFGAAATVQVQGPVLRTPVVPFPGRLEFEVSVHNTGAEPVDLVVDHVVHYVKANGTRTGKVFKGPVLALAAGERRVLQRAQDFRPITTRRHHPGRHAVQVQVNGTRYDLAEFELVMTSGDGPTAG